MLSTVVSKLPGGKYVSGFISIFLIIIALYFAFQTGRPEHGLAACCCPILYLLYTAANRKKED